MFIKRHRAALAALLAGLAALGLFWVLRGNAACMEWWVWQVSMPVKRALGAAADLAPFSVCEAGATLLILYALARLAGCIRRKKGFAVWLLHLAVLLVWGYAAVCGLWGTQYYAPSLAGAAPPVSVEQLAAVTALFASRANAAATPMPDKTTILTNSSGLYEPLLERWPRLAGPERRPKPALYSRLMSAAGFTGYLCPLTGESTLNVDCPAVFLPVTIAHEFAHQRGVAAEQEANFFGVMAAVASDDAAYQYSGWLFGYLHLSNALYEADPQLALESYRTLNETAQADLAANNAYWAAWEGPARTAGETVYTAFLQSYDQPLGMKSYGACVDLLIQEYLPEAWA
ncbi:MAG: DUF3810 domain-containing protein [Gemmiger sp.]